MPAIALDTSLFPLVVTRFPATWVEQDLDTYFAVFAALHRREQPFLHIADISLVESMSRAGMRRKAADFMSAEGERSAKYCKGAVQITQSVIVRGAITAIQWLTPPPYPHAVVGAWAEALAWTAQQATVAGLVLPPAAMLLKR